MSKKGWRYLFVFTTVGALLGIIMLSALYLQYIGLDNVKTVYALHTSDRSVVEMNEEGKFLTRLTGTAAQELLVSYMQQEGWTYTGQEGSGYFFAKDEEKAIITATIWRRGYTMYSVHPKQLTFT